MKLAHIITKLDGIKTKVKENLTTLYKLVQKPAMFVGYTKTYEPYSQTGERAQTLAPETQLVQYRVREVLAQARKAWGELTDLTYQADLGNQEARADIVVDGVVLKKDVPVTTLMFLLKTLTDVHTFVTHLPTPDLSVVWQYDEALGLLRSKEPTITQKTAKVPKVLVKFEPTDKHPGQSEVYHMDEPIGEYRKSEFSGAVKVDAKVETLERLAKLLAALKEARETANISVTVKDEKIADSLFEFAFEPLNKSA